MKGWMHRKPWLRLLGKTKWLYPERDLLNQPIWVCTTCGCHFVGSQCPTWHW